MKIKIVLNGGLATCCSSYPAEFVRDIVKTWLTETDEVEVIDKKEDKNFMPDSIVSLAEEYFGGAVYPVVYIDDVLVALGDIPDKDTLLIMAKEPNKYAVKEEHILNAAEKQGLLKRK